MRATKLFNMRIQLCARHWRLVVLDRRQIIQKWIVHCALLPRLSSLRTQSLGCSPILYGDRLAVGNGSHLASTYRDSESICV